MRYLRLLLSWVGVLSLVACQRPLPDAKRAEGEIAIFPDYKEVTIPPNIAPLNFKLAEPSEAILWLSGQREPLRVEGDRGSFHIPVKAWHRLVEASAGDRIQAEIYVRRGSEWWRYAPFSIHVAPEKIDPYLAYRRIAPGYRMWNEMGIYQRDLESFSETAFLSNKQTNNNCMNCHSFCGGDPDRMVFHQRMTHAGTYLLERGRIEKLDTKLPQTISALVYPCWHPSGRFIAFSTNDTKQDFHLADANRVEVFDKESDVVIYDTQTHTVFTSPALSTPDHLETFPAFSPDGNWLYFCAAPALPMPESYRDIKYHLLRIAFDPEKQRFGQRVDTIYHAGREGRSASFPRLSPDGHFLMYTFSDYGTFSIWHKDADLRLLNLSTGLTDDLPQVNSDQVESYHAWSSNSRWVVFSSRRGDGLYTHPYICYVDERGGVGKPFLLPQQETDYYERSLFSFNIPEFIRGKIPVDTYRLLDVSKYGKSISLSFAAE